MVNHEQTAASAGDPPAGVNLFDLLLVAAKYKRFILVTPIVVAALAAVVSMFLPQSYTATTKLLPPQQGQSPAAALLGQLGGFAALAGGVGGLKNPSDVYVAMLRSRTVADGIIRRFDLQKVYGDKTLTGTRRSLESATQINAGRDGLITIDVDDSEPKRAAALANAYAAELSRLTQTLAVTEASQRRLFLEKQLKAAKDGLSNAEVALKQTQERTGAIRLDEQGKALIDSLARLKAQVAAKEVQLTAMRSFATEANPELVLAQQELVGLRRELAKLEQRHPGGKGDVFLATESVPEIGLEYVRRLRDVKYHETMFELLAKQFEIARMEEARESSTVQVLDEAIEPEIRTKPRRKQIVLLAAVASLIGAILIAFAAETLTRPGGMLADPERLEAVKRQFAWRSRRRAGPSEV